VNLTAPANFFSKKNEGHESAVTPKKANAERDDEAAHKRICSEKKIEAKIVQAQQQPKHNSLLKNLDTL
jgi:hypothetical protein